MTFRTIGLEIENAVYQRAVSKAVSEGKTINQVLVELLTTYAGPATTVMPAPKPAPASPSRPTASTTSTSQTYIVQSGDTLGTISRKHYGSANKYYLIQNANNISDPSQIWVGQRLTIPPASGVPTPVAPPTPAPAPRPIVPAPTPRPPTTMPSSAAASKNLRPAMQFVGSPNFNRRPRGEISAIVMHATANGTLQGVIDWFNRSDAQVSAQYTIGKDGAIAQHVRDEHRAWHAGRSEWQGRSDLNSWAIGIEMVNWNNGQDPYPEEQHQAAVDLCAYLCSKYHINPDLIVAHYDVSPRRKTDPKGYDMDRLRQEVAARI